jgi:hypothetical protein
MPLRCLSQAPPSLSHDRTESSPIEIDCSQLSPSQATQAQWDDFMRLLHCSGKTVRISRETFQYLLQAHPAARPTAPGLWVRDGEGPVMEFSCRRSEDQWSYAARIYRPA